MRAEFLTTHWSLILAAGPNDSETATRAWEQLAQTYWYPVYGHVRRQVASPQEAQDIVQDFFAMLLRRQALGTVAPDKGRFRTFLLTALKHFLIDRAAHDQAIKRGGGYELISFDAMEAEERYRHEPRTQDSPDQEFDRRWAAALVESCLIQLRDEQSGAGRLSQFEALREFLGREVENGEYTAVAQQLGMPTNTVAATVRRLRLRLRELALDATRRTDGLLPLDLTTDSYNRFLPDLW
jgi:RNA polymerase sigma-70 factor (ECF subfamily)